MSPLRPSLCTFLPLLLFLLPTAFAQVSMSQVQPITGFSAECTNAYDTTVVASCSINDFKGIGKSGSCSEQCFNALGILQNVLISACQGQKASGGSLIGAFFEQTGPDMLCGFASGSGGTTTTVASSAVAVTSSSAASSSSGSSSISSSASSASASSSTASSISSGTVFSGTSTSTLSSSSSSSSSSTSTSTSTSTTKKAQQTAQQGRTGGGSPFDISAGSANSSASSLRHGSDGALLWLMSVCWALVLGSVR